MMSSRESEYGHRRPYGDRSTRQWDDYGDGWKERRGHHSDMPWDAYHKYGRDPHTRNREYTESPKRMHSKDSLNRDWSRKSSGRRHSPSSITPEKDLGWKREYAKWEENEEFSRRKREPYSAESTTSPEWGASEKKRQRFTGDAEDDHKYRQKPEDITCRQSPNNFTNPQLPKDFKHRPPPQEDFKYRTPKEAKHRHQHEEFTYRQRPEDYAYSGPSGYFNDGQFEERNNDPPRERTQSHEYPTKSHTKCRDRNDSPCPDYEDHRQTRTRFPGKESSGQVLKAEHGATKHSPALPGKSAEQKTAGKGFQRFLDVLNKGVDVAVLTKIVGQSSTPSDDWLSSTSQQNTADDPSDEKSLHRDNVQGGHLSSDGRSTSPAVVEKTVLKPEDEHKHKQIQDVLQAIGVDLGFEELGQMSDRIQERLYGKKDSDKCRRHNERRESENKRGRYSRSSSSGRSSFGPLTGQLALKNDSCEVSRDVTEVPQTVEHARANDKSSSSSLQDADMCGNESHESTVTLNLFSPSHAYTVPEPPPPTAAMPPYAAAHCTPYSYPAALPAVPPNWGIPAAPTPFLPHPLPPAYPPYPGVQALNTFPSASAQSNTLLVPNRQLTYLNVQDSNPVQPLSSTQKSKTLSRPRYLQVIDTKQSGQIKTVAQSGTKPLIEILES